MADMTVTARLVADSSNWVTGFKKADAAARKSAATAQAAANKTAAVQKRQSSAISGGGVVAMAAAAAIGAYGIASVKAFTDTAGAAIKIRRAMGGSIESASAYGAAAKLAGVDTEAFTKSLGLFDKKLVAANDGGAKAAEMTDKLGTSFVNADGSVKNLGQILPSVADKFKNMKDGPEKTALALQLFGRAGAQMAPLLNRGSAGISDLMAKAKELGLVIDEEGVAKLGKYRTAQREFQGTMEGLKVSLGSALLPAVTTGFQALGNLAQVFGKIPGPVKTATIAVVGFAAASALLGPRISVLGGYIGGLGKGAAGAVRGMAGMGAAAQGLATGGSAATGALSGLSTATGAVSTGAKNMGTGLRGASGGTMAFAAAAAAVGMTISTLVGKFNETNGALGRMTSVIMGATGPFSALGLVFGHMQGQAENFGKSDVPITAVAESLKKLNDQPQQLADAWSRMTQGMSAEEISAAKDKLAALGVNLSDVADAADEAAAAQAELSDEIARYQALTAQSNSVSFKQDMIGLKEALGSTKGAFDNSKAGLENQSKALSMASGIAKSYDQQMKQLADAGQENSAAATAAAASSVQQATALAALVPRTAAGKQAIDGLNQAMSNVPGWKPINISTPGLTQAQSQLSALASKVNMTPKQLRVAISQAGADPTGAKISALARRLGTTPKKLRLMIEALGADKAINDSGNAGKKAGAKLAAGAKAGKAAALAVGKTLGVAIGQGGEQAKAQASAAGNQVGAALNAGAISGIQSTLGGAISAAASAGAQVAQAYKDAAKVKSPSQITTYVGEMLNAGLVSGIESTSAAAIGAARTITAKVASEYGSAAEASAAAQAKSWNDFNNSKTQDAMNKTGKWKWEGKGKKRKKVWVEGPSSGKGDAWRAGVDAAKDYADGIAAAAREAAQRAAELRIQVADQLTSSGKGDWTEAKSASGAKAWIANQLKTVLNFGKNLKTLAMRGLPQSMLQQMISRGVDAAPLAASLVKANAADFNQIASQGAALDLASQNLGNIGSSLFMDRTAAMGVQATQTGPMQFKIFIGDQQINEIVGAEVNGQVQNVVNRMAYS